jgi:periplasmic protein TonB
MTLPDPSRPDASLDALLGRAFEQKPIWADLYANLRDMFFPPHLPPLELTSTPVPVPDRMAVRTNPWAIGTATLINGALLAIVLTLGIRAVIHPSPKTLSHANVDLSDLLPFAPLKPHPAGGGGGGGANELTDPIQGHLPKFEKTPLLAPQLPVLDNPKLAIDPAIAVDPNLHLPDNPELPTIGVHNSPNVTLLSNGPGSRGGMGIGINGGLGPGDGLGAGPGSDQNAGNGVYTPGGGVSNPIPIVTPEAEFSDEARRAKYQGMCMIAIIVDTHGYPQSPRVIRSLGMGLDEKALEAVRQYRFKPALKNGKPVAVRITVAVNFRLY